MQSPDSSTGSAEPESTRYVLLTECFQNDFFLNRECRLYLGDRTSLAMLAGRDAQIQPRDGGRLTVPDDVIAKGPLGVFLEAVIGRRRREADGLGDLHVINIRDWHVPGPAYDAERRAYGSHCEGGTWGAKYIEGLERFLDPLDDSSVEGDEARSFVEGSLRVCHIHADSVFDFRPRGGDDMGSMGKLLETELEDILDILVQGRDSHVRRADEILAGGVHLDKLRDLADQIDPKQPASARVYLAVIGVYSDIKVLTLLGGLLARYDLPNLAVSDTLTGSASLERHISGLDFAAKVMQIEVVHGVNDLVRFLGGRPPLESETSIIAPDGFSRYQTFFKDKQSVLAYQSEKLQDYLALTEKRALDTYKWIERSNLFLILWSAVFLIATLAFAIWDAVEPSRISWSIPAITGGVGLVQLMGAFYTGPMHDLHRNLMNLTTYRMILESHSLKMALARFHLTTPHTLREVRTRDEAAEAKRQVDVLEKELKVIEEADAIDYGALKDLGFGPQDGGAVGSTDGKAATARQEHGAASKGVGEVKPVDGPKT